MSKLPKITLNKAQVYTNRLNDKGQLCNIYTPLQNFVDSESKQLGNFTTDKLNFDMEHPVDIIVQDAYDGAVNLIINDNKNYPRLINTRFSVQDENSFKITDHIGFKDSNVYSEETFNVDTLLKQIPIKIPIIQYDGLKDNGGKLPVGVYTFYFKLVDIDGNETEVIAESGIVQCHVGAPNTPNAIRMGLQDENSGKSIMFTLTNLDPGFAKVRVLFERRSSSSDQAVTTTYHKVLTDYSINNNKTCIIEVTGAEQIIGTTKEELYVDYADINAVKTQTIANNILLFGNTKQTEHDWEELKRISWKIIPMCRRAEAGSVGSINSQYKDPNTAPLKAVEDHGLCYYNTKNTYYRVGYWPGEIYRFGVVYIFEDNSLSPVMDVQGIDFNLLQEKDQYADKKIFECQILDSSEKAYPKPSEYAQQFFTQENAHNSSPAEEWQYPCYLYDTESGYFNQLLRTNSRGVVRFPDLNSIYDDIDARDGVVTPTPIYIEFDMSLIGWERAFVKDENDYNQNHSIESGSAFPDWKDVFKKHKIKGYFFVRQKRIPMTLAQGLVIGLTGKDYGSLPVLKSFDNKYIGQSFLGADRLLYPEGTTFKIPRHKAKSYTNQALLVPDAELHLATYNQIFTSQEFWLTKVLKTTFNQKNDNTYHFLDNISLYKPDKKESLSLLTKLTNVPDGTKLLTNGTDFFSAKAGSAEESFKTEDFINSFKWTVPQDLTRSTSLARGMWGHYVGINNPLLQLPVEEYKGDPNNADRESATSPFNYGTIVNIKTKQCQNESEAVNLMFKQILESTAPYHAISHRTELKQTEQCFRGDCFVNMYTHRMNRNFIDPELPTNTKIVNPECWSSNYAVRCTAEVLGSAHSNLSKDNDGWYIGPSAAGQRKKEMKKQALIYFLTGNIIGGILQLTKMKDEDSIDPADLGLGDSYINPSKVIQKSTTTYVSASSGKTLKVGSSNTYYKLESVESSGNGFIVRLATDKNDVPIKFDASDNSQVYPNGYANEICTAFEMYIGPSKRRNPAVTKAEPNTDLAMLTLKYDTSPTRKKVNPKEQEQNASGFNLKALFKSDDNWELHGVASINRADVNAVGLGQWITFPIMSSTNLQMRDVDFSNATEEASFNRKRSFYPLQEMDLHNPLADSIVVNGAASCSTPGKSYWILPKTPFFKQEYFTRIYNSFRDSSNSVTNQFRLILQNAYEDYTKIHGSITKLITRGNYVYVIFAHGIGVLDMTVVKDQSALDFLPHISILHPDFGSIWKDSIIDTSQGIFGVDSVAKKIWQIQGTNVVCISDMKVQKFLNDNLDMSEFTLRPYVGHINIKTHYNKFKEDVMFTYYNDILWEVSNEYKDDKYTVDVEGFVVEKNGYEQNRILDKDGSFVKAIKRLLPYWDKTQETWTSYSDLIDRIDPEHCHKWQKGLEWSLCYNLRLNQFITFYDWIPLESENIDNIYFSFDRDGIDYLQQQIYTPLVPQLTSKTGSIEWGRIGTKLNKKLVDAAFTDTIYRYYIKDIYNSVVNIPIKKGNGHFVCYLENILLTPIDITVGMYNYPGTESEDIEPATLSMPAGTKWLFLIPEDKFANCDYIQFSSDKSYMLYDPKQANVEDADLALESETNPEFYIYKNVDSLQQKFYELRDSNNSLPLWKHGQAGVYDNQGEIKPTNWYGKQREFNFEFVVNDIPTRQKIFNNLKMVSNKTQPKKFEYEIVGEGYEWWPYKPVIHWINDKVDKGEFPTLDAAYIYVLSNDVDTIRVLYPDFPTTILEYKMQLTSKPYQYKKLPYLRIELTDRKGRQDRSYHPDAVDYWKNQRFVRDVLPRRYDYTFNTNETVIKYDPQLNEYRVHDEQLGNDMWKYGRIRGNMQYLEDLWDIEIRPISFEWCYLLSSGEFFMDNGTVSPGGQATKVVYNGEKLDSILTETPNLPITFKVSGKFNKGQRYQFKTILRNPGKGEITINVANAKCEVQHSYGVDYVAIIPNTDLNELIITVTNSEGLVFYKYYSTPSHIEQKTYLNVIDHRLELIKKKVSETRHRDKYIKVKVRYSGEDLAVIQQIYTLFDESYA